MNKTIFFSIIAVVFLLSCNKQNLSATPYKNNYMVKDTLNFKVLKYSSHGGAGEEKIELINNQDEFSILWANRNSTVSPQPELPTIDFNEKSVILIDFNRSSHGVPPKKVKNVIYKNDTCTINLIVPPVDFSQPVTMAIVNEYMFIVIDKLKKKTNFDLKFTNS
ncbi:hypothetical protein KRX57_01250 [Weeksellaceae bacterium TAE3-ERU29]|nr:hypothetical protein [Weeksellaceae bacterium TAE3-ERU29]